MRLLRSPLPRACGRALLWAGLLLLLSRGALALLAPAQGRAPEREARAATVPASDERASAFAAGFARTYFSQRAGAGGSSAELRPFLAPELAANTGALVEGGRAVSALQATPAGSARLDARRVLVTVRVELAGAARGARYLTVPVAESAQGALAVYDYPSFAPPPGLAQIPARPAVLPLDPGLESELRPLLARFFASYLGGQQAALSYFTPPGVHLDALGDPCDRVQVVELGSLGAPARSRLAIHAIVRARERGTRATSLLSYRIGLEREGRWYVAAVNAAERTQP